MVIFHGDIYLPLLAELVRLSLDVSGTLAACATSEGGIALLRLPSRSGGGRGDSGGGGGGEGAIVAVAAGHSEMATAALLLGSVGVVSAGGDGVVAQWVLPPRTAQLVAAAASHAAAGHSYHTQSSCYGHFPDAEYELGCVGAGGLTPYGAEPEAEAGVMGAGVLGAGAVGAGLQEVRGARQAWGPPSSPLPSSLTAPSPGQARPLLPVPSHAAHATPMHPGAHIMLVGQRLQSGLPITTTLSRLPRWAQRVTAEQAAQAIREVSRQVEEFLG